MTYMRSWKSLRLTSHTWLGLNPQIGRPRILKLTSKLLFNYEFIFLSTIPNVHSRTKEKVVKKREFALNSLFVTTTFFVLECTCPTWSYSIPFDGTLNIFILHVWVSLYLKKTFTNRNRKNYFKN
jgi:hypothetical protein